MRGLPLYGPSLFAVADPGEGRGEGTGPPLFQDQTEARRAEKKIFFETPARLSEGPLLMCTLHFSYAYETERTLLHIYLPFLSIVVIFSLSATSFLNLNSNFCSRYSVFFQCSSGPEEDKFLLAKILAPNKSALCRIDSLVFSFVIFLYI